MATAVHIGMSENHFQSHLSPFSYTHFIFKNVSIIFYFQNGVKFV